MWNFPKLFTLVVQLFSCSCEQEELECQIEWDVSIHQPLKVLPLTHIKGHIAKYGPQSDFYTIAKVRFYTTQPHQGPHTQIWTTVRLLYHSKGKVLTTLSQRKVTNIKNYNILVTNKDIKNFSTDLNSRVPEVYITYCLVYIYVVKIRENISQVLNGLML